MDATPVELDPFGPSPYTRSRRAFIGRVAWDVLHGLGVCAVSLYYLAQQQSVALVQCQPPRLDVNASPTSSVPPTQCTSLAAQANAVWHVAAADPLEASCACFTNFFLISMCGNSPMAWAVAYAFARVNDKSFDEFRGALVDRFGDYYDGHVAYALGACAFLCFIVPFLVHGLLLLPLEIWSPAWKAAVPYKVQLNRRVDASRIMPAVVGSVGLPYILSFSYVVATTRGKWGPDIVGPLPPYKERAWMLLAHLVVNEVTFFYAHWALHQGRLYRLFHKMHHKFTAPIALAAVHAHPVELVVADLIPFTLGFYLFNPHIFFVFMWITGASLGTQTHHCGYRLPWIAGFDEQPNFHDFHHHRFNCCYGNVGWFDKLHGTDKAYEEHKAAKRAELNAAQAEWEVRAAQIAARKAQ